MIKSKGRMIRSDVSKSKKIASLSKDSIILFLMIIPHLNAHGKMNGSPYHIKGEVVPRLEFFTVPLIEKCLKEITEKTSLKWFQFDGLFYIQSIKWAEHQELRDDRKGSDLLPDYSRTTPGQVRPEVEVEVEVKEEVQVEVRGGAPTEKTSFDAVAGKFKIFDSKLSTWKEKFPVIDVPQEIAKAEAWLLANPKNVKSNYDRFLVNWFSRAQDRKPAAGGGTTAHGNGSLARQELLEAFKNKNNRCLPPVSDGAKKLFYEISGKHKMKWPEIQAKVVSGEIEI